MKSNKRRLLSFSVILAGLIFQRPVLARADCPNPNAPGGQSDETAIIYNGAYNVLQYCDGDQWIALGAMNPSAGNGTCTNPEGVEGEMFYNNAYKTFQFCNGEDWIAMNGYGSAPISGGCTPDPSCPNVGDVCSGDGSGGGNPKFAGCICYYDANTSDAGSCRAIYVAQSDQGTSAWKTADGTNDIEFDSTEDGKINDVQVAYSTTFPAFKLCKELTDGGYTDWYLPARTELFLLWRNSTAIGGFTTNRYWSSTEHNANIAWNQNFNGGFHDYLSKTNSIDVRCVRRDTGSLTFSLSFSFTDQISVALSTLIESNTLNINGIDDGTSISITGDGSPQFRINGGSWVTSGTIDDGDTLQLRLTSNASPSTTNSATVTIGTESDQWDVTTGGTLITGVTYTASSVYGGYTGHQNEAKMRDGTYDASDTVVATNSGIQWIKADFGSLKNVGAIHLAPISSSFGGWGPNYTNGYALECSTNDVNWTAITTTSGHQDGVTKTYSVTESCRYIRVYGNGYVAVGDFWFEE